MSDPRQRVLPVEQPSESAEDSVSLELEVLEKSKSAPFRDALERKQHLETLNRRIDVLQGKLDLCEADLQKHRPRVAELEQSMRVSRVLVRDGTVILALGGGAISSAGLFFDDAVRYTLAGLGGGLLICGLWICKVLNRNAWPPES